MIWAFALRALGWIKSLPPWLALVAAVAVWGWLGHMQADKWRGTATRYASALQSAQKYKEAAEAKSATLAKENEHVHDTRLAGYRDATRGYIAANRVRQCPAPGSGGQDQSASLSAPAPAMHELVEMSVPDVEACAAGNAYAWSAYDWGQRLIRDGLAE